MTSTSSSKPLAGIPRAVYMSTLQSRPGCVGNALRALRGFAGATLTVLVFFAPLAVTTWVVSAFRDDPARLRLATTIFFAALFALCLAYHCLELLMAVPWRDRSYPVLLARSHVFYLLARSGHGFSLGATTGAYGCLLWLTWWRGWQASSGSENTVMYAALNTALAAAMFVYGWIQPCGAFRAPTRQDLNWLENGSLLISNVGQASANPAAAAQPPASQSDYSTPVSARAARQSFAGIFGMQDVKDRLAEPARAILAAREPALERPPNGILLHGAPGNGKTIFAEALAGELQVPIVTLTYGDIASKWLGEMPRLISNCFAHAKANAPCVFFIDEIDSFLRSRTLGSPTSEDLKIVNTFLTEIVAIRDHRVVLIGATNHLAGLDPAAIREGRFDMKLEIPAPDETARIGILRFGAAKYGLGQQVDAHALASVARRWDGFSVSRLFAVCKALPEARGQEAPSSAISFDQWLRALRLVQGNSARPPVGSKRLRELALERQTRHALQLVADRLRDAQRIESLGGALPSGILLHGAPGTGKTAAARALALESGWAFRPVAGSDLLADRQRLSQLYEQALDLRPAIIFIDEADDVLADRRFAAAPDAVNRLLALMDGTVARSNDVVLVAATNHPDRIDPALLRAGRFSEKIELGFPPHSQVQRFIKSWLKARPVHLDACLDASRINLMIGAQTIANVEGVLQYAVNRAIHRARIAETPTVTPADICAALKVVSGIDSAVVALDDNDVGAIA